jgi:hypothetical protein
VQAVPDGEVSSYLVGDARPGDSLEVLGPVGGWFVWRPEHSGPVLLIAGGSLGRVPEAQRQENWVDFCTNWQASVDASRRRAGPTGSPNLPGAV